MAHAVVASAIGSPGIPVFTGTPRPAEVTRATIRLHSRCGHMSYQIRHVSLRQGRASSAISSREADLATTVVSSFSDPVIALPSANSSAEASIPAAIRASSSIGRPAAALHSKPSQLISRLPNRAYGSESGLPRGRISLTTGQRSNNGAGVSARAAAGGRVEGGGEGGEGAADAVGEIDGEAAVLAHPQRRLEVCPSLYIPLPLAPIL
ncbi:unnamed protein product [Closterium sp. NIES-53]